MCSSLRSRCGAHPRRRLARGGLAFALLFLAARAALPSAGFAAPFQDGDVVCFAGDSITHTGSYPTLIALFYATRFPERQVRFENAGISGDRASAIVADESFRLNRDILGRKATVTAVMLGMNDIERPWYGRAEVDDAVLAARTKALAGYETAMTQLLTRVQQGGSRLLLFTPTPYDDTAVTPVGKTEFMSSGRQKAVGANAALARCAEWLRDWAREHGSDLVDSHAVMTALNRREQAADPNFTVVSEDRIHPGAPGHFLILYAFLKAQHLEGNVARIVVAADSQASGDSQDCVVRDIQATPAEIRFTVRTRALPFPVPADAKAALGLVPFTEEFNQELLRVVDLREGRYRLAIDETPLGEFSREQLEHGIDLAALPGAPQVRQAARAGRIAAEWMRAVMKSRDAASVFYQAAKTGIDVNDPAAVRAYAEQKQAGFAAAQQAPDRRFLCFQEALAEPGRFEREAAGLYESLRVACQPVDHHFTLSRL